MKFWTISEIASLNIVSESSVKKAIYQLGTLTATYPRGIRSPRIRHDHLVEWLGFDPIDGEMGGTVEITRTVKTKDRVVTTTTRIHHDEQPALFDLSK